MMMMMKMMNLMNLMKMKINMKINTAMTATIVAIMTMQPTTLALMPKKLPGGGSRKFVPNVQRPREDLQLISPGVASLISKNWMQNILLDVMCRKRENDLTTGDEFVYDDLHIMSSIQDLQRDLENSQKKSAASWGDMVSVGSIHEAKRENAARGGGGVPPVLYFAWKPKSLQGFNEVLFVVVAMLVRDVDDETSFSLEIKNVIQSPFWDEEQIPSIYLKKALVDQNEYTNETTLRFDRLYETNLRYKLAWETWFKEMGDL